ncbi:adenylate cyclase type 10-like isoform X1, partial [Clarias magur]
MSGLKCWKVSRNLTAQAQVPDAVLNSDFRSEKVPSAEPYNGVLLLLDIAGFTALTEKYTVIHKQGLGVDELTNGLNLYISKLVECILEEGGDILNYAGDSILAQWLVKGMQTSDVLFLAIKCALKIQKEFGIQEMKYDCELRVKIAISAGKLAKIIVGEKSRRFYVITGPALNEVRLAEPLANPGDVVLSHKTWRMCTQENLVIEHIENKKAVKIDYIKKEPKFSVEMYHQMLSKDKEISAKGCRRSAFQSMPNTEKQEFLKKYMMKVLHDFDDDRSPEFTSKIWPVTVMFINMKYVLANTPMELCNFVQEATIIISNALHSHGHINKIFFFDKDCTFLCVFGLPGCKRKDESGLALMAADSIHKTCCRNIKCLKTVSIGVTTGLVYCGLVGHQLRNEYTVIGNKVNLAARLMMYYPGIVSCDWETRYYSGLPSCFFKDELEKDLKGVSNPGKIYSFKRRGYTKHVTEAPVASAMEKEGVVKDINETLTELNVLGTDEGMTVMHAAFLGSTFSMEMLCHILPDQLKDKLNDILMTLFRSGVFKCARASEVKIEETELICYCESNTTGGLASVVGEWKCQLMCFCKNIVMQMAYQQLLKEQKRQLHRVCVSYLEKKPYRCSKCAPNMNNSLQTDEVYQKDGNGQDRERFLAKLDSIVKEEQISMAGGCRCECTQLFETVLVPIVRHCKGVGDVSRTFHYLLECAAVCASLSQKLRAMQFLKEVKKILENLNEGNPIFESEDPKSLQICKFDQIVMHRLTGEILYNAGNILEAEENFKKALKLLKCSIPSTGVTGSIKLIWEEFKEYCYKHRNFKNLEAKQLKFMHEQITCLSYLWQIHFMRGKSKSASLAITMQSNLATRSGDLLEMVFASIDFLQHSQFVTRGGACDDLKAWLCSKCSGLSDCAESRRLINHFTRTLALVQLCKGNLELSVKFTVRALELGGLGLDVRVIGVLHLPLLLTCRFKESMKLILRLERSSKKMSSCVAMGWFYAGCLNFLLYTVFSARPFEDCLAFVNSRESDANLVADKSLMMHLYSSLALWYARLNEWENFSIFYYKAFGMYHQLPVSIHSLSGVVVFLECSVLLYKKESNKRWKKSYKKTLKLFADFRQRFGEDHAFVPHALYLNAFLYQLVGRKTLVESLLKTALELCEKQGNMLDHTQIKQCEATWSGACSQAPSDCSTDIIIPMPYADKEGIFMPEEWFQCSLNSDLASSDAHSFTE